MEDINWTDKSVYTEVKSADDLPDDFNESGLVTLDTELGPKGITRNGKLHDKALMVQVCDRPGRAFYAFKDAGVRLCRELTDRGVGFGMHNAKFDVMVMQNTGAEIGFSEDTMLEAFLMDTNDSSGLKAAAARYLKINHPGWNEGLYSSKKLLAKYGCGDAELTWLLHEYFKGKVPPRSYRIEKALVPVLIRMERDGVLVDKKRLDVLDVKFDQAIVAVKAKVFELAGEEFEINSPQKVGRILFDKLKLPVVARTKGGKPSTDKNALNSLSHVPVVKLILLCRRLVKKQGTYVVNINEFIAEDGRVHTDILQAVTPTLRLASTKPNMMNQPKRALTKLEAKLDIRSAFIPTPGSVFLRADYSQVEFRLLIYSCHSQDLIRRLEGGEDFHSTTAGILYKKDPKKVTKAERNDAKTFNFGISYGMNIGGIAYRRNCSIDRARAIYSSFRSTYHGLHEWMEQEKSWAMQTGKSRTFLGPLRELEDLKSKERGVKGRALRNVVNDQIQGGAAQIFKMGMIRLHKKFGDRIKLLLPIHDEVIMEVPESEDLAEVVAEVREAMEVDLGEMGKYPVEFASGPKWSELQPFD